MPVDAKFVLLITVLYIADQLAAQNTTTQQLKNSLSCVAYKGKWLISSSGEIELVQLIALHKSVGISI